MTINNRTLRPLFLASAVCLAAAWLTGCAKQMRQKAVPEAVDTLYVITDTLSKTRDTLSVIYDTLHDNRDGKAYKTVKMPDGKTWMAQNLNYKPSNGDSWCYEDSPDSCNKYGRLYDWNTAIAVCPAGWHLPSHQEWNYLIQAAGGEWWSDVDGTVHCDGADEKLKPKSGWKNGESTNNNGNDNYGFSALPGGLRFSDGCFCCVGDRGDWWTATLDSGYKVKAHSKFMGMGYVGKCAFELDIVYMITGMGTSKPNDNNNSGRSVRCVQDDTSPSKGTVP